MDKINKILLMGRLTADPVMRYTTTNIAKCSFTLAVDRRFVKQGEERQADFINIVAWRSTAEFCHKYFSKGQKVVVVGSLQNRNWDDTEGKRHYMTEVIADEVYFAESKRVTGQAETARSGEYTQGQGEAIKPAFYEQEENDNDLPF